jgi:hypothetical protein
MTFWRFGSVIVMDSVAETNSGELQDYFQEELPSTGWRYVAQLGPGLFFEGNRAEMVITHHFYLGRASASFRFRSWRGKRLKSSRRDKTDALRSVGLIFRSGGARLIPGARHYRWMY